MLPSPVAEEWQPKGEEGVMDDREPFSPHALFGAGISAVDGMPPQVLAAPSRYIQGDGVLNHLGRYLTVVPTRRTAILISAGGPRRGPGPDCITKAAR